MKTKKQRDMDYEKSFEEKGLYRMMVRAPKDREIRKKIRKMVAQLIEQEKLKR